MTRPTVQALIVLTLLGAACSDSSGPGAVLNEQAEFQSLTIDIGGGPCPTGQTCSESFALSRDGTLVRVFRGQRFEARLSLADLDLVASIASSEIGVEALRKVPGCPAVMHGSEQTEIQFAPGVFVNGDISGCTEGPMAALRNKLYAAANRVFPQSQAFVPPAVPMPDVRRRFWLRAPVTFQSFTLERRSEHCSPGPVCAERMSVDVPGGRVSQLGGSPRGEFTGVTDFEPLGSVAIRPDVIAELRKPRPCSPVTDLSETVWLTLPSRFYLRAQTIGCNDGPIASLRNAARALVSRLAAGPAPDAAADHPPDGSAADHPPDLAPP